jgi:hypothetical protein
MILDGGEKAKSASFWMMMGIEETDSFFSHRY